MASTADPGSFRDPLSRVFVTPAGIRRGLSTEALNDYRALATTSFFAQAMMRGDIVGTRLLDADDETAAIPGDWAAVLAHDPVDVISYPYEWAFEMLRDAARLQLRLTRDALAERMITKDASSYNVQFVGTRPVFIDVGSFERSRPGEPWAGYRQFCELFLNPLLVQALRDVPFQPLLRGSVHGISPATTAGLLPGTGLSTKGVFTHVKLHARVERRYSDADQRDVKAELKRAGFGPALIDAQLRNLLKAIDGLTWKRPRSTWSDYSERSHYADADLQAKEAAVAAAVRARPDSLVLDLGANDGHFSRLALRAGARSVVAVDSDHLVVDRLYRDLRGSGEQCILPLVLDLSDPSPGLGWRSRERRSFVERVRPDVVLCLAVVHHLALTNTVPLEEIVALLADFGADIVVEFPHPDDEKSALLLRRKRQGIFERYNVANWEQALAERFTIRERTTLPGGTRTLYRCAVRPVG